MGGGAEDAGRPSFAPRQNQNRESARFGKLDRFPRRWQRPVRFTSDYCRNAALQRPTGSCQFLKSPGGSVEFTELELC
jgi:hypothetical protein